MKVSSHIAIVLALIVLPFAPNAAAQVVWTQSNVNGHWYTLVLGTGSWCDWESTAQSYGGHLATVRNAQEQVWIVQNYGQGPNLAIGIGGNDAAVQGTYVWTSGEPFTLPPNNPSAPWDPWVTGEPNHLQFPLGVEHHAYMSGVDGYHWTDACGCCPAPAHHRGLIELVSGDCDQDNIPDLYEIATGAAVDCNVNGIPDSCDLAQGTVDCDGNGLIDSCEIASNPQLDCNANSELDMCDIASGTSLDPNGNGIPEECESSITTYCSPAAPNSVSASGSSMTVQGVPSTILNNLVFTVNSLPPNKPGLFIYGPFHNHLPIGNGYICVGGYVQRVTPGFVSSPQGTVVFPADLTQFPFTGGVNTILPGSTWNFQFWHRDPFGGVGGFNFSDAVKLTFAP